MSGTRKLAAILVADVVCYSRLAGADADRTLSRLRALCRMTAMARTPVLPEATPEGALSAQLRRRTAIRYVRCTSIRDVAPCLECANSGQSPTAWRMGRIDPRGHWRRHGDS